MTVDGDKLMMCLSDWWYSSFGEVETEEAKAIRAVLDKVEEIIRQYEVPEYTDREKGEWTDREIVRNHPIDEWQSARCGKCGKYHTTPYMYYYTEYAYCPDCGASMIGGQNGG